MNVNDLQFMTPILFMIEIERLMIEKKLNHIEAVTYYCDKNEVDYEDVVPLITRPLKEKIHVDAMDCGLMRKEARLPV